MLYLVDTGVWLRLFDRSDPQHPDIRRSLQLLRANGHSLGACPQNIAEFWNVSTRPSSARGGYGKSVATTELRVRFIERNATILNDSPTAYHQWRNLLGKHQIQGLAVHDARIVSVMMATGTTHLLTLNGADFARYLGVVSLAPKDLIAAFLP
jgi:predicted nucleic acid-binding protein